MRILAYFLLCCNIHLPYGNLLNVTAVVLVLTDIETYGYKALLPAYDVIFETMREKFPHQFGQINEIILTIPERSHRMSSACVVAEDQIMPMFTKFYAQNLNLFEPDLSSNSMTIVVSGGKSALSCNSIAALLQVSDFRQISIDRSTDQ